MLDSLWKLGNWLSAMDEGIKAFSLAKNQWYTSIIILAWSRYASILYDSFFVPWGFVTQCIYSFFVQVLNLFEKEYASLQHVEKFKKGSIQYEYRNIIETSLVKKINRLLLYARNSNILHLTLKFKSKLCLLELKKNLN